MTPPDGLSNLQVVMQELGPDAFPQRPGEHPSETWARWGEVARHAWDVRRRRLAAEQEQEQERS